MVVKAAKARDLREVDFGPVAIVGGSGFVGLRLAQHLSRLGAEVVLCDLRAPVSLHGQPLDLPEGVRFMQTDVCELPQLLAAFRSCSKPVNRVFSLAAFGMSGAEARQRERIFRVNEGGTRNLLQACTQAGVQRLVYTSTYNVVFGGEPIDGGDESHPYVDESRVSDAYSVSKARAERMVLAANLSPTGTDAEGVGPEQRGNDCGMAGGTGGAGAAEQTPGRTTRAAARRAQQQQQQQQQQEGGKQLRVLRTCAIRPAGIWGPGELRHLPRLVGMLRMGVFKALFGDPTSLVDWVHVDNLVGALELAARALGPESSAAAGQVFFISDDAPINNFDFFKPFIVGLGYPYPSLRVPLAPVQLAGRAMEVAHSLLKPCGVQFTPILSRAEVDKCAVTHWFRMDKARRVLGYKPRQYTWDETVEWFAREGFAAQCSQQPGRLTVVLAAVVAALLLAVVLHAAVRP